LPFLFRWGLYASVDKAVHKMKTGVEAGLVDLSVAAVNPAWHSELTCTSDLSVSSTSFADIIRDELLQTTMFEHSANKSLSLIQVRIFGSYLLLSLNY